jgi:hypothetical protein
MGVDAWVELLESCGYSMWMLPRWPYMHGLRWTGRCNDRVGLLDKELRVHVSALPAGPALAHLCLPLVL